MKILVTGGAGYIGGTVAQILMDRGYTVVVYDNLCHARPSMVPPGATFVDGDVADSKRLGDLFRDGSFAGVMHFAALIEAGESMRRPEIYFRNNTMATLGLLEAIMESNLRKFVFSSTAAVYGEPLHTPITEDAALLPTNPYGESKLLVEQMLSWMQRIHGLRYASLRYFNVAGAIPGRGEAHEPESHLIPLILDVALGRRDNIKVFGQDYPTSDGTAVRDYIHVQDLAEAHLLAFRALDERERMIYNLGNGRGFTVREVVESARRVTGHPIPVDELPRRPGDPAVLIAGSTKIESELGWKPKYVRLDDIMSSAWEWHQQRYRAQ
ncbi:MAG: UDP-glucose 4-epimerase GalE [Acidobacteriaceae bacterium]